MLKNSVPQIKTHPTVNLFEPVSSGLTKKFIHSEGGICLELGLFDFTARDIGFNEDSDELGDCSDYDDEKCDLSCTVMGGKSKRKHRRKSRKTRRKSRNK